MARGHADRAGAAEPARLRVATTAPGACAGSAAETAYLDRTAFWVGRLTRLTHVGAAARDERVEHVARVDAAQRLVLEVDLDLRPRLEPERAAALVGAEAEQPLGREDAARPRLAAGDPLELAQLLERVDADVRVGADAERDPAMLDPRGREEAVREIGLGRRAGADGRAALGEQIELRAVGVRRVDDRDVRAEAAGAVEQLDRPAAVLGEALLDLARLLVGVDVQRQPLRRRVAAELLEPVARAGADGVGGEADADAVGAERLELAADTRPATPAASAAGRRDRRRRAGATSSIPASAAASAAARASARPR